MTKSLIAAALGLATAVCTSTAVLAQTPLTYRSICQAHGPAAREELPDRKGHFLVTSGSTCRIEGGPMDGGVQTNSVVSNVDGDETVVLSGVSVNRKPGGSWTVSVNDGGKVSVQRDAAGKVTGSVGSGRGHFVLGVGDGASLTGRKFTYSSKSVAGQAQSVIDVTVE